MKNSKQNGLNRKIQFAVMAALALVVGCSSVPPSQPAKDVAVTILHQSNRQGVTQPCGCQTNPYGGLDREMNAVESIRKEGRAVFYLDAGNAFLDKKNKKRGKRHEAKAAALLKMLNVSGLDVFSPGRLDYRLGVAALKGLSEQAKFPFLSSNVMDSAGSTLFQPFVILERGGLKVAVISVTPPTEMKEVAGVTVKPPSEIVPILVEKLRRQSDFIVLLSQMGTAEDDKLAAESSVDVLVGADLGLSTEQAFAFGKSKTLLVDSVENGFRLGRLDIELKLPFKGFSSPAAIAQNLESLANTQARAASRPDDKALADYLGRLHAKYLTAPIAGGSDYRHELIRLDKERYGKRNAVTKLIANEKRRVRKAALGE